MSEIVEYIKSLKLEYREKSKEVQADCPLCSDVRGRLGINKTTGQWHCFNCHSKGSKLDTLKKAVKKVKDSGIEITSAKKLEESEEVTINPKLGSALYEALRKNRTAVEYLVKERGLTTECVKHFKLGCRSKFTINEGERKGESGTISIEIRILK